MVIGQTYKNIDVSAQPEWAALYYFAQADAVVQEKTIALWELEVTDYSATGFEFNTEPLLYKVYACVPTRKWNLCDIDHWDELLNSKLAFNSHVELSHLLVNAVIWAALMKAQTVWQFLCDRLTQNCAQDYVQNFIEHTRKVLHGELIEPSE